MIFEWKIFWMNKNGNQGHRASKLIIYQAMYRYKEKFQKFKPFLTDSDYSDLVKLMLSYL